MCKYKLFFFMLIFNSLTLFGAVDWINHSDSIPEERIGAYLDLKLYNNVYSQLQTFDETGNAIDLDERNSFLTSIAQITFGNNRRLHFGLDVYFRASRTDGRDKGAFNVLRLENNQTNALTAFTHFGPKVIWKPIKSKPGFSIKSVFLVPLNSQPTASNSNLPFVDNSGNQLWVHFAYNAQISSSWYLYSELTSVHRFDRNASPPDDSFLPMKVFLSYYPKQAGLGLFTFFDYTPTISAPTAHYIQIGGGIKIYPFEFFEIELSGGKFIAGNNTGAGSSFNLGLGYRLNYE
jgi:hypothetical protein